MGTAAGSNIWAGPLAWGIGLGFLVCVGLFLWFRAAVRGEEVDARAARRRDAMVALTIACLLAIIAGAFVAIAVAIPWSIPLFAAGLGGLVAIIGWNRRLRHESAAARRIAQVADAMLTAVLLSGSLVVANVLAFRYADRPLDFTRDRSFSLAELTVQQLRSLDQPVTFTLFHGSSPLAARQQTRVLQFLDLCKAASSGQVHIEEVARYANPTRFEELVRRLPEVGVMPGGGVVVEYGTGAEARHAVVRFSELFEVGPSEAPEQFVTRFTGEDVLTSALVRLRENKPWRVAFTVGHGEPSLDDLREPTGLGLFEARLASLGATTTTINLVREPPPTDLDILFVVGARTPFDPREADRLRTFVDHGGRVVLLLDGRQPTSLETWLASFGVGVGSVPIIDPHYNELGQPEFPLAPVVGQGLHPIVASLQNQMIVVPQAVVLSLLGPSPTGQQPPSRPLLPRPVLRTSPEARLANAAPGTTEPQTSAGTPPPVAPFIVGIAVSEPPAQRGQEETPRMVVISSPSVAANELARIAPANQNLLINAVGWLRGKTSLIGIAAKTHVAQTLMVEPRLRARLVLLPTLLAFTAIVGMGVFVYVSRRR